MSSNKLNHALEMFDEGFSCSQSIFCSYADSSQISRESALRLSDAMSGGMGGMAETCGAITGAFLAIGLKYGRIDAEDDESKINTRSRIKEFNRRFKELNGSTVCKDLLECDISTPEGKQRAVETGVVDLRCPGFVKDAALILEQVL